LRVLAYWVHGVLRMSRVARRLRISVATAQGALPVMIGASVATAEGCSALVEPDDAPSGGSGGAEQDGGLSGVGGGAGAGTGSGGASGTAGVGVGSAGTGGRGGSGGAAGSFTGAAGGFGNAGTSGIPIPPIEPVQCFFTVELPPEGVPAEPGQICAAKVVPVESNRAARVVLDVQPPDLTAVMGLIEVAPELLGMVVGLPAIELLDASAPSLMAFTVASITPDPDGFRFRGTFPNLGTVQVDGLTRVTLRVSLQVMCPDAPQLVHAVTDAHLCGTDAFDAQWVSSGSVCSVCRVIAEMAPSPIVPDGLSDGLPLSHVLRLRVVELARVSGSVVLLAEHDGGEGLDYEWRVSEGEVKRLAPDVIAWTLPVTAAAPYVQVAAFGADAAAVASWAFNAEAA
jgi:hypothetical protein